jgi:murein L,D-transpeptidase YcbB/YkuD
VTDQIVQSNHYLNNKTTEISDETKATAPKNEIKYGQKSNILKSYQFQNNLSETGIFDDETLKFIQEQQDLLGFNVTKTLDFNTWFATYPQPINWQKTTILEAQEEWNSVINKQINNNSSKFVVVNIPSMKLTAYNWNGVEAKEEMESKVVVGKVSSKTPFDDFSIWGLKYHPTWTPTPNMLKRNVYTSNGINTSWLRSHGVKAVDSKGRTISYDAVSYTEGVRFVQPAGNNNALGILKFETNSNKNIYLHDTNEKNLFKHNTRAYSSGCIRVEDYVGLAQWSADIDENILNTNLENRRTRIDKINEEIPVYFTYSLVTFKNNEPIFSPDIYRRKNTIDYK